jgi:tetratricopeptide (TPR) repeat protein
MNKQMIGITSLGVLLGVGGVALAQLHQSGHSLPKNVAMTKNEAPLTPAQKARLEEAGDFEASAKKAMDTGHYAEAEAAARAALAAGPDAGFAQETLAGALYAQGKDQQALQAYAALSDTGFARNLLPYALLSLKTGHWVQAVAAYNNALPHLGFGDLMRQNGEFSPTKEQPAALEAAIEVGMGLTGDGGNFHGTYQQRNDQSQVYFQKALALEPNSPLTNYYYGYGLQRMGHWKEAQTAFKKAASLDDGNGDVKAAAEKALAGR